MLFNFFFFLLLLEDENGIKYTPVDDYLVVGTNIPANTEGKNMNALPVDKVILHVKIPEKVNNVPVKIIGSAAFRLSNIRSAFIPSTVIQTNWDSFAHTPYLKSVIFAENSQLNSIGYGSFYKCPSLRYIRIPASVDIINENSFGLDRIKIFYCGNSTISANIDPGNVYKEIHVLESYPNDMFGGFETIKDYHCELLSYFNLNFYTCKQKFKSPILIFTFSIIL